ncbi:MAG: hypothetical protein ACXAC8_15190 [Candidatus Hodarchaeales archaeon]
MTFFQINCIQPAEPHLVVGQRSHEKRFEKILSNLKQNTLKENIMLISGSPGIGKTSFLKVCEEIAKNEMVNYAEVTIGMGRKKNQNLFRDIYQSISPYLTEEKTGLFKKSKEVDIKSFTPKSKVSDVMIGFADNLKTRPPKRPIVISLDSLDRIIDSGQKYILDGLEGLIKTIQGRFPVLFIATFQEYNVEEIKSLIQMGEHFILDRLDFSDSKLLLSKIGKGKLRTSSHLREELVKQSDRSPFNLVFIVDVVRWIESRIKQEGMNESESTLIEMATPYVRNFALRGFINEVFHISEEEDKAIQVMLSSNRNAIAKDVLDSAKIPNNIISSLETKGLIARFEDFYQFTSYALFSSLGSGLTAIDLKAEAGLLLQILEADMMMGFEINPKVLERLEQASYSTKRLEDQTVPNRTKSLYNSAFETEKFFEAYRLSLLTGNFLRMAKDIQGAGLFFEECAQEFQDQEKIPYAIALYRKSLETFMKNERKKKDISQRTAMLYLQRAEKHHKQEQLELARASYFHAFKMFERAGDINSATEIANKAIKTYASDSKASFFKKLLASTLPKSVETSSDV